MMRILVGTIATVLTLIPSVTFANAIEAVQWLESNQNTSGSWGEVWFSSGLPTTEARDTTAAVQSLLAVNATTSSEFGAAVSLDAG